VTLKRSYFGPFKLYDIVIERYIKREEKSYSTEVFEEIVCEKEIDNMLKSMKI
jgi:hypothetical protein